MKIVLKERGLKEFPMCELLPGKIARITKFEGRTDEVGKIVMVPYCNHNFLCQVGKNDGWDDLQRTFNLNKGDKENFMAEYLEVGDILEIKE